MRILLALGALLYMVGVPVFPVSAADQGLRESTIIHYGRCYNRVPVIGSPRRFRTDPAVQIMCTKAILRAHGRKPNPCGRLILTNYGMPNPADPRCVDRTPRRQQIALLVTPSIGIEKYPPKMISGYKLKLLAREAGWPELLLGEVERTATCESGDGTGYFNLNALNTSAPPGVAVGLMQIRYPLHAGKLEEVKRGAGNGQEMLFDGLINLKVALKVYQEAQVNGRSGWSPWQCLAFNTG